MNNNDSKLFWIVIGLAVILLFVIFGSKVIVNKVADQVIQKLQKDYSPSPYGPGIDPDKLDLEKLKRQKNPPIRTSEFSSWEDW